VPISWALGLSLLVFSRPTSELLVAGIALALAGEAVRVWASGHLDKDRRLTTTGPYALTRNPLYFGSFVVGLGFCVASGRPLFLALLLLLFRFVYVPVMRREAARLESAYPEAYGRYAARVPLFLPRRASPDGAAEGESFSWDRVVRNREHVTLLGIATVIAILCAKAFFRYSAGGA
jgi:protein-S-isoprenylcysteine O-methyltransferase Ste14